MNKPEPVRCATCGGDIDHFGKNNTDPMPGNDFTTLIQNQARDSESKSGGWVHMKTEYDPEAGKVTRFQHVERDVMHPAVPHDGRTPEMNDFIKQHLKNKTNEGFFGMMENNFPEGYGKGVEFTKPCVYCGTPVDADTHEEEGGMCLDCHEKYYNGEMDNDGPDYDLYKCGVCGRQSANAEDNMNHRCFE